MALTDNNYAQSVDHLVNNMTKPDQPFDTKAYANYKALVDKKREEIDSDNLLLPKEYYKDSFNDKYAQMGHCGCYRIANCYFSF